MGRVRTRFASRRLQDCFWPFVHTLAAQLGLARLVGNDV
jgi:hypothetical protein